METSALRFDDATRAVLRRRLLDRGRALATLLADVLAGKQDDRALRAVGLFAKPGLRPDEVLRAALDQVDGLRRLIDAGDDRYGRCGVCADDLGLVAITEVPWADACHAHARGIG